MKIKINKAVAIDISPAAIEVSTVNANNILTDYQPIEFIVSDAVDFSSDISFDVIVSNPPYISNSDLDIQKSVKDFEPHLALFAKEEGMFCIKMWILTSLKMLKPKGFLMFEMGHNQGAAVQKILSDSMEFSSVELINDFSGLNRFIKAVRNG
jgi:release factor glutamine methyltransferase